MGKAHFETDGYAIVPMFHADLVRDAQADISDHIDRVSDALYLPFEESRPEAPLARRLDRIWKSDRSQANLLRMAICTDAHRGPRLRALAQAPHLLHTAEALAGQALGSPIARVRASIGVFPEHLHAWHSDVSQDDGTNCASVRVTAWIPLSDVGPDRGGLEIIRGRRTAPLPHRQEKAGQSIDDLDLMHLPRARPACPAGHVLFLDRFTPHRGLPPGPDARFALVVWMKAA